MYLLEIIFIKVFVIIISFTDHLNICKNKTSTKGSSLPFNFFKPSKSKKTKTSNRTSIEKATSINLTEFCEDTKITDDRYIE